MSFRIIGLILSHSGNKVTLKFAFGGSVCSIAKFMTAYEQTLFVVGGGGGGAYSRGSNFRLY